MESITTHRAMDSIDFYWYFYELSNIDYRSATQVLIVLSILETTIPQIYSKVLQRNLAQRAFLDWQRSKIRLANWKVPVSMSKKSQYKKNLNIPIIAVGSDKNKLIKKFGGLIKKQGQIRPCFLAPPNFLKKNV